MSSVATAWHTADLKCSSLCVYQTSRAPFFYCVRGMLYPVALPGAAEFVAHLPPQFKADVAQLVTNARRYNDPVTGSRHGGPGLIPIAERLASRIEGLLERRRTELLAIERAIEAEAAAALAAPQERPMPGGGGGGGVDDDME